jgi:hypothetical protein
MNLSEITFSLKFKNLLPSSSVAEPHHFYAAPAPCENFDAAPVAPALVHTLLYNEAKFFNELKFNTC